MRPPPPLLNGNEGEGGGTDPAVCGEMFLHPPL